MYMRRSLRRFVHVWAAFEPRNPGKLSDERRQCLEIRGHRFATAHEHFERRLVEAVAIAHFADGADKVLHAGHALFHRAVLPGFWKFGPGGNNYAFGGGFRTGQATLEGGFVQDLPDRLGDEGHDGLYETQYRIKNTREYALGERPPSGG